MSNDYYGHLVCLCRIKNVVRFVRYMHLLRGNLMKRDVCSNYFDLLDKKLEILVAPHNRDG